MAICFFCIGIRNNREFRQPVEGLGTRDERLGTRDRDAGRLAVAAGIGDGLNLRFVCGTLCLGIALHPCRVWAVQPTTGNRGPGDVRRICRKTNQTRYRTSKQFRCTIPGCDPFRTQAIGSCGNRITKARPWLLPDCRLPNTSRRDTKLRGKQAIPMKATGAGRYRRVVP